MPAGAGHPHSGGVVSLALRLLLLLLLAAPSASAAGEGAILIFAPSDRQADLGVGDYEEFRYEIRNLHPTNPAFAQISATAPPGWAVRVQPTALRLAADKEGTSDDATAVVFVTVGAASTAYERGEAQVTFSLASADRSFDDVRSIVLVPADPHVLGLVANPLPAPFVGAYAVFALDLVAFAALGAVVVALQRPLVRVFARHASRTIVDLAVGRLRVPVLVLFTFLGLQYSIAVLPPSTGIDVAGRILDLGIYVVVTYLGYKLLDALLTFYALRIASKTETKLDDLLVPLLRKIAVVVAVAAGLLLALRSLDVDLTVFVAGGVVASIVLAMAAQETLSNFFSGLHLMIDRPFVEGDLIQLTSGEVCRVERVGLRSTHLYHTRRHEYIVMPNNKLSSDRVTNMVFPDRKYRTQVEVGVAYGSDVEKVKRVLLSVARAHPKVLSGGDDEPRVYFVGFGDSALNFWLHLTLADITDRIETPSDIREAILREFRAAGVEIPFPQRDLWLRSATTTLVPDAGREAPRAGDRPRP